MKSIKISLFSILLLEVLCDFFPKKTVMLGFVADGFFPGRPCEPSIYTDHVFEIVKSKYAGSFVEDEFRENTDF
jgi:hypothetical protein